MSYVVENYIDIRKPIIEMLNCSESPLKCHVFLQYMCVSPEGVVIM